MPEIRQDPTTREWVIIATERAKRPHEFKSLGTRAERVCLSCVFCPGNESQATPEVWRLERNGHWCIRVVANKFPALTGEATGLRHETPPFFRWMDGFGYHEVIIETPEHDRTLHCMREGELVDVLLTYRQRYQALRADPRVKLVLLFKNHGERAGTSIVHPHSQVIATPVIPIHIRRKYEIAVQHYDDTGRCLYCDIVDAEDRQGQRVVQRSDQFLVFEPYASRFPFETWIAPIRHSSSFGSVTDQELPELAGVLGNTLRRLHKALEDPHFNLLILSAPVEDESKAYFLWHIEIIPRLTTPAGFELGSGMHVNPCIPEEAARFLREASG
ncbi:MAG TPA: galactose-1-phosphate uridylyltransferase [Candidatus Angelobacter sp.]